MLWKILDNYNLSILLFFVFLIVPSMMGTFFFLLRTAEVHPLVAVFGTIGIIFGGVFTELWNVVQVLPRAYPVEILFLLVGMLDSLHRIIFYFIAWFKISRFMEGKNLSVMYIFVVAVVVLGVSVALALVVDLYVLEGPRLPGLTYALTNLETVIQPVFDLARDRFIAEPGSGLNSTVNNSSVSG